MTEIHKILIVRLSSIGDIILTTPLVRCVRKAFPKAEITFVIKKQYAELLSHTPHIDHLVTFDSTMGFRELRTLKNRLKSEKFDLFIDIHRNLRSFYLRWGIGAKKITSYSKRIFERTLLILTGINLYHRHQPVYLRYFKAVRAFGIEYDGMGTEITVPHNTISNIQGILKSAGYRSGSPLVAICPGATYTNKQWLPERYVETASSLIREKGAFVVVHGGRADADLCEAMVAKIGKQAVSFAGHFNLIESAALLKICDMAIANDSGLLHLAQSQKTRVIGIYGPTTRELGYYPLEDESVVVETHVSCRPCTHNGLNSCPRKHFRCMRDISARRVSTIAMELISK